MRLAIDYGLKTVIKNGRFIMPDAVKALVNEYEMENNPVLGWLDEHRMRIDGETTDSVYEDFYHWCLNAGHRNVISKKRFSRELNVRAGYVTDVRNGERCYFLK
jgi:putative DNA primase/helicase